MLKSFHPFLSFSKSSVTVNLRALGRYQIRGEVGRGTMGIVYRGYDPVIDRSVAIKTVLLPETLSSSQRKAYLERFFLEAKIAGKLLHPNIVVTYDATTDDEKEIPFIVMELVEGESLSGRLMQRKKIPWPEALDIVIPVARALDYAHGNGVVHRDIKPANVLIAKGGEPKITDFGIAKVPAVDITQTGVVMGTPAFMSPEQLQGETIDGRSDLFSLTAVLYSLLVGKPPFEADDLTGMSQQILYKDPKPPSELVSELPAVLDGVLARGFSKSPLDRYPSGQALAEDLIAVRSGEPPRLAMTPGEKTQEQIAATMPSKKQEIRDAASPPVALVETLDRKAPSRSPFRRSVLVVFLLGAVAAVSVIGPENVAEQARPLWDRFADTVASNVEKLKTDYDARRAERERIATARSEAEALIEKAEQWAVCGQWARAREAYQTGFEVYRDIGDGVGEAKVLLARGRLEARSGNWSKARADLDAAAAVSRIYEEPLGQVRSLTLLANLERDRGNPTRANAYYDRALQQAATLEDQDGLGEVRFHKALHDMLQGKWASAREGLDGVRRNATRNGRDDLAVEASKYLGVISYVIGDHEMTSTWWNEVRQACQKTGSGDCLAELKLWEGRAALDSGDLDGARMRFESAAEHFREQQHLPGLASALENLADVGFAQDDTSSAHSTFEELFLVRSRLGLPELEPLQSQSESTASEEQSRFRRLSTLLRALPRTALSEERASHIRSDSSS
jgi:serine/threonine protein kinase/tetratricopeptide (TPR) repeat protein